MKTDAFKQTEYHGLLDHGGAAVMAMTNSILH